MTPDEEKQLISDVGDIKRGVFGDPHLKQPGLLDRMSTIEGWIGKANLKIASITGGATVVYLAFKYFEHK